MIVDSNNGELLRLAAKYAKNSNEPGLTIIGGHFDQGAREAAQVAYYAALSVCCNELQEKSIELHCPDLTAKNGSSMMLAIVGAIVSLQFENEYKLHAMTGEVDDAGNVLRISGTQIKAMCALRYGIPIILPIANELEYLEVDSEVRDGKEVFFISNISQLKEILQTGKGEKKELTHASRFKEQDKPI